MLELMPTAEVWHLGLFRDERTLRPVEYYNKLPDSATVDLCLILDSDAGDGRICHRRDRGSEAVGARRRIKLVNLIVAPEAWTRSPPPIPTSRSTARRLDRGAQRARLHHAGPR